jgi:carboxymethylenebutenolidase
MRAVSEATGLKLRLEGQTVPASLALPDRSPPHPGVLVIHEIWGLTADIERICERLATAGYAALAPELYGPGPRAVCIARTIRDLARAEGELGMGRAAAAFRALRARPEVDAARTGAIGFCMGGGFALLLGASQDMLATSVNYGRVPEDTDRLAGLCPVVGSYGGRDRDLVPQFKRLRRFLEGSGVPHDLVVYPQAGHSFMNRTVPGIATRVLQPLAPLEYRHTEAEDAWRRILAFFAEHLGGPPAGARGR